MSSAVISADRTEYPVTIEQWRQAFRDFYALRRESMARLFGEPDWDIASEEPRAVIWFRAV